MNAKAAAAALGAVLVVAGGLGAMLLGGEPSSPGELQVVPAGREGPQGPGPLPSPPIASVVEPIGPIEPVAPTEQGALPIPTTPAPTGDAPAVAGRGEALRQQVREIVARGEGAATQPEAARAGADLGRLLDQVAARGREGYEEALALLDPALPSGVQEVGVRLLGRLGASVGRDACVRLADVTFDPRAEPAVRLLALRSLRQLDDGFAQGAIGDVAQDREQQAGVRMFAMDQLEGAGSSILEDVARDPSDEVPVRVYAVEVLLRIDPARGRDLMSDLRADPALAEHLDAFN